MPQFHFSLEGVLRQRKHAEEECQRKLAFALAKMREIEDSLRELDQTLQASLTDVRQNRLTGKLDLGFLAAYRRYVASVQRKGTTMAQRMALLQRDVDFCRKNLAEAAKQRKIIEKLRDKQLEKWKLEQVRKEAADQDEISMRLAAASMAQDAEIESTFPV